MAVATVGTGGDPSNAPAKACVREGGLWSRAAIGVSVQGTLSDQRTASGARPASARNAGAHQ